MIAIPVSKSQVIVIESRRKLLYDAGAESLWSDGTQFTSPALAEEGVLVYTVDASVGGGEVPLKVAGDPGNAHFDDNPLLTAGESVTVNGYTIRVESTTYSTHTITVTKTANPRPGFLPVRVSV